VTWRKKSRTGRKKEPRTNGAIIRKGKDEQRRTSLAKGRLVFKAHGNHRVTIKSFRVQVKGKKGGKQKSGCSRCITAVTQGGGPTMEGGPNAKARAQNRPRCKGKNVNVKAGRRKVNILKKPEEERVGKVERVKGKTERKKKKKTLICGGKVEGALRQAGTRPENPQRNRVNKGAMKENVRLGDGAFKNFLRGGVS